MNKARVAEAARGMIQLKLRPTPRTRVGLNGDGCAQAYLDDSATSYRCTRLV